MSEPLRPRPCPACGAQGSSWAFFAHDYPHLRCDACKSLFVAPLPPLAKLCDRLLDRELRGSDDVLGETRRGREEARRRAAWLVASGVERVLEVGCGYGDFLDAARELGIEGVGVDPGPAARVAAEHGHEIHSTWIERFDTDRTFDAIVFWNVLEELVDPLAVLERVRPWLRERGVLALSTPSATGLPARIWGRRFSEVSPPDHLALFSHEGLPCLLTRAGFSPIHWSSFSPDLSGSGGRVTRRVIDVLARAAEPPLRWLDETGFGRTFQVLARRRG